MRLCEIAMREWKRGMHGRAVTRGRVGASTRCDVRVDRVQSEPGQSQCRLCWMLLEDDARVGRMDPFGVGVVRAPATGRDISFGVAAVRSASMAFAGHMYSLHFSSRSVRLVGSGTFDNFGRCWALSGTRGQLRVILDALVFSPRRTVSRPKTVMCTCDMAYHNDKHTHTMTSHVSAAESDRRGRAGE